MDLVVTQHGITVCLNPDPRHCVVKDLIVFDDALPPIVHEDAPILSTPDLVSFDQRVASRPEICHIIIEVTLNNLGRLWYIVSN